jgi:LCP family protein required for cell wall assembly
LKLIPSTRGGALWRFAAGGLIVIVFTATATAVAGLLQFKQFAADLSVTPALKHAQVTIPDPGKPQTILIIGSDHRAGEPFSAANTDTMMLVRLDPSSTTINVISIPRDLRVEIPEGGGLTTAKLNSAYSVGGPNLLIRVLRRDVFPGLGVNHIVDVNFGGFEALVNAIGCVYTDVDHRYYNDTLYTNYSSIDIQPGYQKLCGPDALSFVRFRHTDNDIVRNARQQDFIRWAKDQYGPSNLISNRDTLLKIFGQHVQTDPDLHTVDGLINLFNLVAFSAGHTIRQVHFPAILLPCAPGPAFGTRGVVGQLPCYVTADPGAEQRSLHTFMTPTQPAAAPASASPPRGGHPGAAPASGSSTGLIPDFSDGQSQAASIPGAAMPVYVPRLIASGSRYCTNGTCTEGPAANSYPRDYTLSDQNGHVHVAYRMTLAVNPLLGQYYGVQGTTWFRPPILASPSQTRVVAGKRLLLFANGGRLGVVAWRTRGGTYWISNTLTQDLTNQQMVGIAASLARG